MNKAILPLSDIDINISVSSPKILSNGGKMCYLSMPNRKQLVFKTPTFKIPYGLSNWENTKFHIDVSLNPDSPEIESFKQKILDIEEAIIDEAFNNSVAWFGKKQSREVVMALFTSSIKSSKDTKYPPTMKLKLPFSNDKFKCDAYNYKKEPIDISENTLTKGSTVQCIVQCSTIWIAGNKFGPSFNIVQVKVDTRASNKIVGYAFVDDSDDECEL
jgi:hypothetical protein